MSVPGTVAPTAVGPAAAATVTATPKSANRMALGLKKKSSADDVLKSSRRKISVEESSKENLTSASNDRRSSSTLENYSGTTSLGSKNFPTTPRRRSMTSLTDENTNSLRSSAPAIPSAGVAKNKAKCASDTTKLAPPKTGKLFRGGSNNIPKFDLPFPPPLTQSHLDKENENDTDPSTSHRLSPRPVSPHSLPLENQDSCSAVVASPLSSESSSPKKKRRVALQESNPNISTNGETRGDRDLSQNPRASTDLSYSSVMEAKMRRVSC
jgi:hypothetical protein